MSVNISDNDLAPYTIPNNLPTLIPIEEVIKSVRKVTIDDERFEEITFTDYGHFLLVSGCCVGRGYSDETGADCCMVDII